MALGSPWGPAAQAGRLQVASLRTIQRSLVQPCLPARMLESPVFPGRNWQQPPGGEAVGQERGKRGWLCRALEHGGLGVSPGRSLQHKSDCLQCPK